MPKESTFKSTEEATDGAWARRANSLSPLPRLQAIDYGTLKLLADLSVEPTPSNAQLFKICKKFNEPAKIEGTI